MQAFHASSLQLEGIEGYVICFDNGHRIKLKTSSYALRHKALSSLSNEKNVLKWVVEGITDDILPLLSEEHAKALRAYELSVRNGLNAKLEELEVFYEAHKSLDRRDYAMAVKEQVDPKFQQVVFGMMDGKDGLSFLVKTLTRATQSNERVNALRDLIGTNWVIDEMPE